MGNILVLAEHQKGTYKKACLSAISAGLQAKESLNSECYLTVIGSNVEEVAKSLSKFGADKVLLADDPKLKNRIAEADSQVIVNTAKQMDVSMIIATATTYGKDLMPRVAASLGVGMASDILEMTFEEGDVTFKRPMYAGNAIAAIKVEGDIKVATVRGTAFAPAQETGNECPVERIDVSLDEERIKTRFIKMEETKSERPELTEAEVIVSGGRGMKGPEGFKQLEDLADIFNAAIGATRAAVDNGWVPNDLQVGQTGKIVAPNLYFAFGISGALQHLAGMKDSKVIVAVNKDEEAPIFEVADYGIVADLFKVLPDLGEQIKKVKEG